MKSSLFQRYGAAFGVVAAVLLPFKLTLGYIGLIPLIVLWLLENYSRLDRAVAEPSEAKPLVLFCIVAAVTSLFGINPLRSISHFGTLFFFPLTIFAFRDLARVHGREIMSALLCGQAVACFNAILENAFRGYESRFLGPVSQSGQLSLTLFLAVGLYFSIYARGADVLKDLNYRHLGWGIATASVAAAIGFSEALRLPPAAVFLCIAVLAAIIYRSVRAIRAEERDLDPLHSGLIATVLAPIMAAALLVNLKRGPWAGIFIGGLVFCFLHARRLLLPLLAVTVLVAATVNPVQRRLLSSEAHFFITGGRNAIWQIGGELALKYPMGIGFENSGFLRKFSSEIPQNLKHFHNNLLNITVETGWLGLLLYIVACYTIIRSAFCPSLGGERKILASAIGCGLIAWQVAGLVEYNFGDSAVVNLAYMMIGILFAVRERNGSRQRVEQIKQL